MITSPAVAADIATNGNTGTGTYAETFNVTTPDGQPVPPMTLSGSVTMTRQSFTPFISPASAACGQHWLLQQGWELSADRTGVR